MNNSFSEIIKKYEESFDKHGNSPASLLTPKGRGELRYRAITPFVRRNRIKILDYGCGLGYLLVYLLESGFDIAYTGVDMVPSFIRFCKDKYGNCASFETILPEQKIMGQYDVVFASGVFNLKTHNDPILSKKYAYEKIEELFQVSTEVLICDFLSQFVDFQQADAQHFGPAELVTFCVSKLSRRFQLRHDLLPYEFTLVVHRNSNIERPDNFYNADLK